MRIAVLFISFMLIIPLVAGCGEDDEESEIPTTGTVSGTITFIGTPPEGECEIQVSIFSSVDEMGRPTGPPDHYSEPCDSSAAEVSYTITGVSFGTYKLAAVGYESADAPMGQAEIILGMYGFAPPDDMQSDSFTISEDDPDITGIDIIANYAEIEDQ